MSPETFRGKPLVSWSEGLLKLKVILKAKRVILHFGFDYLTFWYFVEGVQCLHKDEARI